MGYKMGNARNGGLEFLCKALVIVTASFYLPILLLSWFAGDKIDYYFCAKEKFLLPNLFIFLLVILTIAIIFIVFKIFRYVDEMIFTKQLAVGAPILTVIYTALFFVNRFISKCIAYEQGWDVSCVCDAAHKIYEGGVMGTDSYFILYPNNIPITYILAEILKRGMFK